MPMTHATFVILIGILPFIIQPFDQQPRPLLVIDFSLDSKGDRETHHTVIRYSLTEEGQEYDVRIVYDWAFQAGHRRELSKDAVVKIKNLLRRLPESPESPESKDNNIPKDLLVIVTVRDENNIKVNEYHRKKLPPALKEVLELLGGIRFELRDTIGFSSAGN